MATKTTKNERKTIVEILKNFFMYLVFKITKLKAQRRAKRDSNGIQKLSSIIFFYRKLLNVIDYWFKIDNQQTRYKNGN
jgi:hypothetical protein